MVNRLLKAKGKAAARGRALATQVNQLKAMVDVFHVYGIAVLLDVVYNHAGGSLDDESLYYFDRQPRGRRQPQPLLHRPGVGRRQGLRVLECRTSGSS